MQSLITLIGKSTTFQGDIVFSFHKLNRIHWQSRPIAAPQARTHLLTYFGSSDKIKSKVGAHLGCAKATLHHLIAVCFDYEKHLAPQCLVAVGFVQDV